MAARARRFQASDERCDSENSQNVTGTFAVVSGSGIKRCLIQTASARFVSDYCEFHNGGNNLTVVTNVGCGVCHYQWSSFCIDRGGVFAARLTAINGARSSRRRQNLEPALNQS